MAQYKDNSYACVCREGITGKNCENSKGPVRTNHIYKLRSVSCFSFSLILNTVH